MTKFKENCNENGINSSNDNNEGNCESSDLCCNLNENRINIDQLTNIHKTLIKCQELGDQKVELISKIIDLLDAKTKQLILDSRTLGNSFRTIKFILNLKLNWCLF